MVHFYFRIFKNALQILFNLFDHQSKGKLVHTGFIEILNEKLGYALTQILYQNLTLFETFFLFESMINRSVGTEFVDLLDTLWYVFINEADADFETFCRIFKSKGVIETDYCTSTVLCLDYIFIPLKQVLIKLFGLVEQNKSGQVSVDQVMTFFTECTLQR